MNAQRKTALITGAGSGLGRAIAVRLARDGWELALADLNLPTTEETLRLVQQAGGAGFVERLDVADRAAWPPLAERLRRQWPQLDLLVNNAGVSGAALAEEFSLDDWQWLLSINLHGVIYGCHTFVPWLKENPRGAHLINTASLAAFLAAPEMGAYNVAKAGVLALSETLYAELRPHGVGVTVLCPGFFQTGLLERGRFNHEYARGVARDFMRSAGFTADDVAAAAVRAIGRKRLYVIEGRRARWLWRLRRWFPLSSLKLISWGAAQHAKKVRAAHRAAAAEPSQDG